MAQAQIQVKHTGNAGLYIIGTVFYLSFIGLFLWQTAQFVNWLFPEDQVIYRIITVCMFDVMALFWACIDTFYRFATRASHELVKWAWTISFIAALVASVFYMVLQSFTRLNFTPDITWIDVGFGIVILVTVLQVLFFTFWLRMEWLARHPKVNDYEYDVVTPPTQIRIEPPIQAETKVLTPPAPARQIQKPLQGKKQLPPRRKFTPRTPAGFIKVSAPPTVVDGKAQSDKVTVQPPLSQAAKVRVKKNTGPYVVNKKSAKIPLND